MNLLSSYEEALFQLFYQIAGEKSGFLE